MSDSQRYRTREGEVRNARRPLETLWNILGFGFALAVGAGGFVAADWFVLQNEVNHWVYLPPELSWPAAMPYLGLKIAMGIVGMSLGGIVFTLLYGLAQPVKGGRYDVQASESDVRGYRR